MYNIALLGAGRIGQVHAANIAAHPLSRLSTVVDPQEGIARQLAEAYGASVRSLEDALSSSDIDAIVIASATSTHADLIERGIRAGKAVFCEKPVDLSISRVNATLEAIKGQENRLFVAFNRRFDPAVAELKRRLDAGVIGDLELVTVVSKDPGALPIDYIKVSGGMFRDMTIHDFDMARFILGEEPVRVTALASTLTDPAIKAEGDIDTASVTLQTASGKIAVITNSRRASFGYDQRVEAHGSLGTLRTENVPKTMLVQEREDGVTREKPLFFFLERYAESYAEEWKEFVRVLKGEVAPAPSGEDGRKALLLAEAAYQSLETGRTIAL
ncbi:MAG: inositol 2-dehydrogenase [Thalassospira sp.]|uniref:Inositol 2-dehydrogenase n=1 Tax=Thalassospira xiamenensis TaxID=220697 RepID=A0ABR5Y327_9PROT|nr:inositol 2-dehydrogenase [Thalassospira xiamenensis]MAL29271.1 inositol 2-dehydrogenase [Thalassospira sp.]MBR9780055.1 inositol 2-dehydrogenase [Rhodospirillales bacterium]QPL37902.1 inositol 2-dehydrogenase [Thalassospira sp. B30-1]KZD08728.1 inositol 2-dehydrogenase [Thalassospira xiamenensis]